MLRRAASFCLSVAMARTSKNQIDFSERTRGSARQTHCCLRGEARDRSIPMIVMLTRAVRRERTGTTARSAGTARSYRLAVSPLPAGDRLREALALVGLDNVLGTSARALTVTGKGAGTARSRGPERLGPWAGGSPHSRR
jgi:hypothetical protein